jgi:hypothetical protein
VPTMLTKARSRYFGIRLASNFALAPLPIGEG